MPKKTMTSSSWKWKTWLLLNFEPCEGKLVAVREILAEGERVQEKVACPASSVSFGHLIKQIWGDKVKLVKRGSRKERQNYYLGLTRKSPTRSNDSIGETEGISKLKTGWHLVSDQGGHFSTFARYEPWSFCEQRVVTEVRFAKEDESYSILLTSHGCQVDLTTVFQLECLEQSPIRERIESVLTFIDTSTLCRGVPITDGEVHTLIPYKSGIFSEFSTERTTETVEHRAFSVNCSILSSAGQPCSNCKNLHYLEKKRQKRKLDTNGVISRFTNKRYLTKEELTKQLQLERQARLNAEKRAGYWREKCGAECTEMENDDDHADLSNSLDQPEELANNNKEDNTATGLVSYAAIFCDVKKQLQGTVQQEKLEDARKELVELNGQKQEAVQSLVS